MNKTFRFVLIPALVAAFASTAAIAQEATPDYPQPITSSTSRADVRAQAVAARDAGLIATGELADRGAVMVRPDAPRVRVQAELGEARRLGLIADGERNVEPTLAQLEAVRAAGDRAATTRVAAL
jgi:hypothetical protein